jgi:hypothetical protein
MAISQNPAHSASGGTSAKLFYGFVIALLLFIIWQPVLLTVTDRNGGFEGMGVVLVGVVATPALLVLNSRTMFIRWRRKQSLLLRGLLLPSMIGLAESLWTIGPASIRHLIDKTIVAPFLWVWLFIGLLFFPLIASAVHTARRRSG